MLRNQKHISKAKKLVQNLTLGPENDTPPATPETSTSAANEEALLSPVPLETLLSDHCPLTTDPLTPALTTRPLPYSKPETRNRKPTLIPGSPRNPGHPLPAQSLTLSKLESRNSKLPFRKRETRNRKPTLIPVLTTRPPAVPMNSSKSPTATSGTILPNPSPTAAGTRISAAAASLGMLQFIALGYARRREVHDFPLSHFPLFFSQRQNNRQNHRPPLQ